jgi:hypothetical protein
MSATDSGGRLATMAWRSIRRYIGGKYPPGVLCGQLIVAHTDGPQSVSSAGCCPPAAEVCRGPFSGSLLAAAVAFVLTWTPAQRLGATQ